MVNAEGWSKKNGSKWQTMPDQMFVYRAAAFWQRAYAPELGMGLQTVEDVHDGLVLDQQADGTFAVSMDELRAPKAAEQPQLEQKEPATVPQQARQRAPVQSVPDPETGEIQEPAATQPQRDDGATSFADAHAAIRAGDIDIARDIARSLPEQQRKQIESAIANMAEAAPPQAQNARRGRGQSGLNLD